MPLKVDLTWLHWACLLLGTLGYFLIKALQKYREAKAKATPFFWGDYMFSPETMIPLILTLIFGFFAMLLAVQTFPHNPIYSSVSTGLSCTAGYAVIRSSIISIINKPKDT